MTPVRTGTLLDLSANENPLGPSPKAVTAMQTAMGELHRYPDRGCRRLKAGLGARLGVTEHQIAVGNGACEILDLAVRSLIRPGASVILGSPGVPAYRAAVRRAGGRAVLVPARNYRDHLEAMLGVIDDSTRLVLIGNPANPTGTLTGLERLLRFLDRLPPGLKAVIDESCRDFVDDPSYPDAVELLKSGRPVIAVRSFSKAHGLAGLRLGYAIASEDLIARMDDAHQPFNTNRLAQAAALGALEDEEHVQAVVELNQRGRAELFDGLVARGFTPIPSQTNFILVPVQHARQLMRQLEERGVLVKNLDRHGADDCIRVSVGLPEWHARFFQVLDELTAEMDWVAGDGQPPRVHHDDDAWSEPQHPSPFAASFLGTAPASSGRGSWTRRR